MKESLAIIDEVDYKSTEMLRGYIENIFDYTKPIDRSKYPSLTDELFNELYDYVLQSDLIGAYHFENIEDINQRRDAIKLLLNLCTDKYISYFVLKDVYINSDDNERKELYNLLEDARISIFFRTENNHVSKEFNRDDFHDLMTLLSKNYYDEQTLMYIFFGMKAGEDSQIYNFFNKDETISLSFGDLKVDIPSSDFLKYCITDSNNVHSKSFDYYSFFSDYVNNNKDLSDDSLISFNLNGIDFLVDAYNLRFLINILDTKSHNTDYIGGVSLNDEIQTKIMGILCQGWDYRMNEKNEIKKINVLGYPLNMSISELCDCLDYDGNIIVEKILKKVKLTEKEKIYFQHLLPDSNDKKMKLTNKLKLSDLNIIGHGKALDFFHKYGSVMQTNLKSLSLYHAEEEETKRLIQFCKDKYRLSEDEAYLIMRSFGRSSGCTVVDACNTIYELYDYDAVKFEQDFGYPMLIKRKMPNGEEREVLNGDMLLLDLYISSNIGSKDDNNILIIDENNNITINEEHLTENKSKTRTFLEESQMIYFGYDRGRRYDALNDFFLSNGIDILQEYQVSYIDKDIPDEDKYNFIVSAINDNKIVSADIGKNGYYEMYQIDTNYKYECSGGHAVTVSGVTEEGVLVNSWGDLYYIPFEYFDNFYILDKK